MNEYTYLGCLAYAKFPIKNSLNFGGVLITAKIAKIVNYYHT